MLLRFAKLAGGLRFLMAEMAPLVVVSAASLSARSAAYIVGFTLGFIGVTLWPIVAVLITIAGIINPASQSECDCYYSNISAIVLRNEVKWQAALKACFQQYGTDKCDANSYPYGIAYEPIPCTPPNCNGKKVWLQAVWASPSEFASQSKSCFLIAYSYEKTDGLKVEYNPFKISELF